MYNDSVHSGLTTVRQFVPSIFLSVVGAGTDQGGGIAASRKIGGR